MKERIAQKAITIEDGKHTGRIVHIIERAVPYAYVDFVVRLPDATGTELKVGYADKITEGTALGKLIERFGVKIVPEKAYNLEKIFMDKEVSFLVMNEKGTRGTFANIVPDSLSLKA